MEQPVTMLDHLISDHANDLNEIGIAVLSFAFRKVAYDSIAEAISAKADSQTVFANMREKTDVLALKARSTNLLDDIYAAIKANTKSKASDKDLSKIQKALLDAVENCSNDPLFQGRVPPKSQEKIPLECYKFSEVVAAELKREPFFTKAPTSSP